MFNQFKPEQINLHSDWDFWQYNHDIKWFLTVQLWRYLVFYSATVTSPGFLHCNYDVTPHLVLAGFPMLDLTCRLLLLGTSSDVTSSVVIFEHLAMYQVQLSFLNIWRCNKFSCHFWTSSNVTSFVVIFEHLAM